MKDEEFRVDRRIAPSHIKGLIEQLKDHLEKHKNFKSLSRLELHEQKLWNEIGIIHFMVVDKISEGSATVFLAMPDYNFLVGKSLPKKGWFWRMFTSLENHFDYEKIDFIKIKVPESSVSLVVNPTGVIEYKIFARSVYQIPALQNSQYGMISDMMATEIAKREHEVKQKHELMKFAGTAQSEASQLHDMKHKHAKSIVVKEANLKKTAQEELEPTKKPEEKKEEKKE